MFAASSVGGWRWRALATLRPGAPDGERWIGQQCLTGDGRQVVAVVAPWHANNSEAGMGRGGLAYAIDARTGAVRPLAAGVSLAYFNPGCGAGRTVALTSYLGRDQATSRITVMDARSGAVLQTRTVAGELTSAVPVADGAVAARGGSLVRLAGRRVAALGRVDGLAFDLRPDPGGGVDLLAAAGERASVWRWDRAGLRRVGGGRLDRVGLPASRAGRNTVADQSSAGAAVATSKLPAPAAATTALPSRDLAAGAAAAAANTTTPTCGVPRNSLWNQVPQPSNAQVDWAVQQATRNWLTSAHIPGRPGDPQDYRVGTQAMPRHWPDQDFPHADVAGYPGAEDTVPPQVLYGILAQESNWNQASWHALAGYGGNPLVANFYGASDPANPADIDYDRADCGYGIGQITDGMRAGQLPAATQVAVATDYAENVAAAVKILVDKWNQLAALGIRMNDGNPAMVENWYGAIWAYNSGVHLVGNGEPNSGLGWFNNPANPIYPPDRHPFLHNGAVQTYDDAKTPQYWPYQEKVLGWAETPQVDPEGHLRYAGTYDWATGGGKFVTLPGRATFCGHGVNACNPTSSNPCPNVDATCWWNAPARWVDCSTGSNCTPLSYTIQSPDTPEPAPVNRHPACTASGLPSTAIIVDDAALPDQNPGGSTPNVVGCPTTPSGWRDGGTFRFSDADGDPLGPGHLANLDLHQLGTGFGGHIWFTHSRPFSDVGRAVTGTWAPTLPAGGLYELRVFVPTPGATSTHASYQVTSPDATGALHFWRRTLNQNPYSNQWISLGFFPLWPGAHVSLDSVTPAGDTSQGNDVAFDALAFVPVAAGSYVALGDSYASGEGTGGPWDEGTDVTVSDPSSGDLRNLCHRSPNAYQRQYAAMTTTFRAMPVVHLACSGSTMWDVAGVALSYGPDGTIYYKTPPPAGVQTSSNRGSGGSAKNGEPSPQVDLLKLAPSPRLVTVGIGGNDMGFGGVIVECAYAYLGLPSPGGRSGQSCQRRFTNPDGSDQVSRRISGLRAPLTDTFKAVKAAVPATTTVVAVTYPAQLTRLSQGLCSLLRADDAVWLSGKPHELDQVVIAAARDAGISVLDEEQAFAGHELCTDFPWIKPPDNPLQGDDSLKDNYYHPTTPGYRREAQDLKAFLPTIP
ncbi:MAG TPA: GDSL-type esterase/lipase family protein [Actinomycetes bacterium]